MVLSWILALIGILIIVLSAKTAERTRSGAITVFSLIMFLMGFLLIVVALVVTGVLPWNIG